MKLWTNNNGDNNNNNSLRYRQWAVHYYKDRRGSVFQQANDRHPTIYLHLAVDSGLTYLQNKVHVELLLSTLK